MGSFGHLAQAAATGHMVHSAAGHLVHVKEKCILSYAKVPNRKYGGAVGWANAVRPRKRL